MPDLRKRKEIHCPDCGKPYTAVRIEYGRARSNGCSCKVQAELDLPLGCIWAGFGGCLVLYGSEITE